MKSRFKTAGAGAAMALALGLTACGGSGTPAAPQASTTGPAAAESTAAATFAASTAGCVADPLAVTAHQLTERAKAPVDAEAAAALEAAAVAGWAQTSAAGAVVAVQGPGGTWSKAYGLADPGNGVPMATDTHQRIGSVTKTFTGTLVLQLAEAGKLSLEDPISRYAPEVPNGANITLRMLLNMTSGISSYTLNDNFTRELFADPTKTWTPDQLLAIGLALPPQFTPGKEFNYSNTNTILLGKVVESVTGSAFADVLQEQILDPLALSQTSMPGADDPFPAPHAQGFTLQGTAANDETPRNATGWNPTWAWTAGQMVSTVDDLLVYGRALGTGQGLLDPEAQVERLSSMAAAGGYGLAGGCVNGWFGHTGELPGYNTSVFYDTQTDTTVAILANSDIPTGNCTESKTPAENPKDLPCMDPTPRILASVSAALGRDFTPPPKQ